MSIKYEPKFSRVLIEREVKEKTAGGIIIPDTIAKRHASCVGKIVALGETAGWVSVHNTEDSTNTQIFKVGDKVIFGRHSGAWLDATYNEKTGQDNDDGRLFICQDEDILAVVRN